MVTGTNKEDLTLRRKGTEDTEEESSLPLCVLCVLSASVRNIINQKGE
jgi:hypothetical protein